MTFVIILLILLIWNIYLAPNAQAALIKRNINAELRHSQSVITLSILVKHFNPTQEQIDTFNKYYSTPPTFQHMVDDLIKDYPEWMPCFYANYMRFKKEDALLREKHKASREDLDYCFSHSLSYKGKKLNKKDYRINRRKLVLFRQKELIENGFLVNDGNELENINEELVQGVKDKSLVCPCDIYPHNPYPHK